MVNEMSVTTANRIADFVSTLSARDKAALSAQLAYGETVVNTNTVLTADESLFWDAMGTALYDLRLDIHIGPSTVLINGKNGKGGIGAIKFRECSTALHDYVTHACRTRLDRSHRRAIYVETISCLLKWMRRRRYRDNGESYFIPLSAKAICNEIGELPLAVNRCYPGYVKAGLLHVVVPRAEDQGRIRVA